MAGGEGRVVEEAAPGRDAQRLGVVHGDVPDLGLGLGVEDRDGVVEAGEHVEPVVGLVEGEPRRPAAADRDLAFEAGDKGVLLQRRGAVRAHLAGAEGGHVERGSIAGDDHPGGQGQALGVLGVGQRGAGDSVVDVLVEVARRHARPASRGAEDRDPVLDHVATHAVAGDEAEPFKAALVPGLGVGDVDLPAHGVDGHVVEDGADAAVGAAGDLAGGRGRGVEGEHVFVGEREADVSVPVAVDLVLPVAVALAHDQARRGGAGGRAGHGGQAAVGRHHRLGDRRGAVARAEGRRVDPLAVGADREGAGRVAEEGDDGERIPAQRRAEVAGGKDPHVRAADARRGELRVEGAVLPAVRGGDEGPPAPRPGKDDVTRLVADEQGAHDAPIAAVAAHGHDADAVGEVIDDPHLTIAPGGHRHRLQADGDGAFVNEPAALDLEALQSVVRGVDGEEQLAIGREREGADLAALEGGERRRGLGRSARERRRGDRERAEQRAGVAGERARRGHCTSLGVNGFSLNA